MKHILIIAGNIGEIMPDFYVITIFATTMEAARVVPEKEDIEN